MEEFITIDYFANLICMMRAGIDGAILLVNNRNDEEFFALVTSPQTYVVVCPDVLLAVLKIIKDRGYLGIAAAISQGKTHREDDVFESDLGDTTSILLTSNNVAQTIEQITGLEWSRSVKKEFDSIVDYVIQLTCCLFNYFKIDNVDDFQQLFNSIIDWKTCQLSEDEIIIRLGDGAVKNCNDFLSSLKDDKYSMIQKLDGIFPTVLLVCVINSFHPRGIKSRNTCTLQEFLLSLRIAFNLNDFERDSMYWQMRYWQRKNRPYALLREWRNLDPLNVTLDQRYWESDLQSMLKFSKDEGLTAIQLDLDNFKYVNEKKGHNIGDEAIRIAGKTISKVLQETAEVYRRGGDEFVAFAPNLHGSFAAAKAEELRIEIERTFIEWGTSQGLDQFPTASIGIVDVTSHGIFSNVVDLMDQAQKKAKSDGKNRVVSLQYV